MAVLLEIKRKLCDDGILFLGPAALEANSAAVLFTKKFQRQLSFQLERFDIEILFLVISFRLV